MQTAARVQSAIELLDLIICAAHENGAAADTIIAQWFRIRRYAGSKDRRAVRDLVYRAIRNFGEIPGCGRDAVLGLKDYDDDFDGSPYGPAKITSEDRRAIPSLLPGWLETLISVSEHAALLDRAPLDLRVNTLLSSRAEIMTLWPDALSISGTSAGLRLPENTQLANRTDLTGLIEVQDAGSQIIAAACDVQPGQTVIDLCAGAGGKTLALAADMSGQGRLVACDTDKRRLSRLPQRAASAAALDIEIRLLNPKEERGALHDLVGEADVVLVDAPCSGTGTWRRNPELRWRLTPKKLQQVAALQRHVIDIGAELVKPGGALIYAVCSLLDCEGRDQISGFLARQSGWRVCEITSELGRPHGNGLLLTPRHDGTDGFFVARLRKL
jgi:16S rRNA (cytosine967-C5)-methyltransferase